MKRFVTLITLLLLAVCALPAQNPEPAGWYSGDMHAHRSCGGSPESVSSMFSRMTPENLAVASLLADSGNGEVQNATTDLPLVNGQDASVSTSGHVLHWDSEWHWDAIYSQYAHQALGGHIVNLGLSSAQQLWQEYTFPILDWAHQHNGIAGFAHMQYLDGNGLPNSLTCCTPIEYPVEVALGAADFISEDVDDVQLGAGSGMYSETPIQAYYKLLNSGFRPGLAAGTDYPCNGGDDGGALGALLTYVQMPGNGALSYRNWVQGIANGRTVVSRNGYKEFLALTVNGTSTPGDQIDLSAAGTVSVTVKWTASQTYSGTIELVQNGTVVASLPASVTASTPATLTTTVNITKSGWLAARRMGVNPLTNANEHYVHTGAVFTIVGGAPVRASQADAQYFVNWTTGLINNTNPGGQWNSYFPTSLTQAQARYKAAQAMYQQIASEASGIGSTLSSIAITPTNKTVAVGSQTSFSATGTYANGTSLNITGQVRWSSSNPAVATINARGLASAIAAGAAVITASMGSVTTSTGITVGANPLAISTASLPGGTVGVQYTGAMAATGGTTPYTWSVTGGSLPAGLVLNTTTGAITGSPTAAGTSTPTIQVVDSSIPAQAVSQGYTIVVSAAAGAGPYSIWPSTAVPGTVDAGSDSAVELGVQFRSDIPGNITGIRFYKSAANTGTHTGSLWSSTGTRLATATFSGETASGWQQVNFATPVAITANTTYVASYHLTTGHYADDQQYFATSGVDNAPLHALMNGSGGAINGVYAYGSGTFPNSSWNSSNYWVDVVFTPSGTVDGTAPTVTSVTPSGGATGVDPQSPVSATFSEGLTASTVTTSSVQLLDPTSTAIQATVAYNATNNTVTLTPTAALANSTTYTIVLKGGVIKDLAGNALAADYTSSFTTAASAPPPPSDGPGGPILIVSSSSNPFSRYFTEILRSEGLNEFLAMDISQVTATTLNSYDVVILGNVPLTSTQVSMFTSWVNNGGNLIAMRPDPQMASLLGLSATGNVLPDAYMLMNTSSGPGAGLVSQAIQYHGNADLYVANGATVLATLYSDRTTGTSNPAVTLNKAGLGQAAAFTYDLARSVVYTRQGNPAWSGEPRDGQGGPMRSDDLFFGAASFDPQPDYVDRNNIAIPQADEQQRLLANLIIQMDLGKRPLPRFWYFPGNYKAAVVMTGDDHGDMYGGGATANRFSHYSSLSPAGCSVANWQCVRATAYLVAPNIAGNPLTNSQALSYINQGFEVGAHVDSVPDCSDWTTSQLASFYSTQIASFKSVYTSVPAQKTHRMHCIGWSDYDSQPQVELQNGIRLDTNYYYWPPEWVNDTPGLFTGSGMPMRFTKRDGTMLDVYQATTQMTDESSQSYPATINALLNNAVGANGYYGFFTANMHNDDASSSDADGVIASAQSLGVPVISAAQLLTWLDGRNGSSFTGLSWNGSTLSFGITAATGATNLQAMLPIGTTAGTLSSIKRSSTAVSFTVQTIKGMAYAVFPATAGSYTATYVTGPILAQSVRLSPTSVTGGGASTATITFNALAPAGAVVTLTSSNPAAATVPSSITLAATSTTATFTVTTSPVATATPVTISATYNATTSANLTVNPPTLSSVALSPTSVSSGGTSTGTVTLNGPAPSTNVTVTLTSSNTAAATVPATVVVNSGATTATFTVATTVVTATTSVTITAAYGTARPTARLTVTPPPALSTVTLSPTSLIGGATSTGTVRLTQVAGTDGFVVNLSSANPTVAVVPASVTVLAGSTTATFSVTTTAVAAQTPVVLTGSAGTVNATATLTVNPPSLSTLSRSPSSVIGGVSSTGTVTLTGPAPIGDFAVTLSSANPSVASAPAIVAVPAGTTSATFTITTTPVTAATAVVITASAGTVNLTTTVTVNPPAFSSVTLSPSSVVGGVSSTGTLTLSGMAPDGTVITLTSSNTAAATVPASVTFAAGATTATFPITTSGVTATTRVTISATLGTVTRTATLTVNRPALSTLVLSPTSVKGGTTSTGTVTLTGPAGSSGLAVTLSSSSSYATVPATVTVPAGSTTATFTINTLTTTRNRTATISATYNTVTRTGSLTVTP